MLFFNARNFTTCGEILISNLFLFFSDVCDDKSDGKDPCNDPQPCKNPEPCIYPCNDIEPCKDLHPCKNPEPCKDPDPDQLWSSSLQAAWPDFSYTEKITFRGIPTENIFQMGIVQIPNNFWSKFPRNLPWMENYKWGLEIDLWEEKSTSLCR
jgi:hypothetical protein